MPPEGDGHPKGNRQEIRELTYEAVDEVVKTDISEAELAAIRALVEKADLTSGHIPCVLAHSITLSYEISKAKRKSF
jgi:hypothetical protein